MTRKAIAVFWLNKYFHLYFICIHYSKQQISCNEYIDLEIPTIISTQFLNTSLTLQMTSSTLTQQCMSAFLQTPMHLQ